MHVGPGEAVDVIELQPAGLAASAAALVHEGAAPLVPLVHRPLDRIRDVPRPGDARRWRRVVPRLPADCESLLLQVHDESFEGLVEDHRQLPAGNAVAEEILRLPELVPKSAGRGELDLEGVRGERRDDRPAHFWTIRRHRAGRTCLPQLGWLALRKLPDAIGNRRLRRKSRGQLFDLALGLARRLRQETFVVLVREMRRKDAQSSQMNGAGTNRIEDRRPAPRCSGHVDPVVGRAFGESELLDAERDHGGERARRIEPPRVDLAEMEEEVRLDRARLRNELPRGSEKVVVVHHRDGCV
jgi:hypothetical protein